MSKERWIQAYEELESELDREPTSTEVNERYADNFARAIDAAKDLAKYGPIKKQEG